MHTITKTYRNLFCTCHITLNPFFSKLTFRKFDFWNAIPLHRIELLRQFFFQNTPRSLLYALPWKPRNHVFRLCVCFLKIASQFYKVYPQKLEKNYVEILENLWTNIRNALHKLLKKRFYGDFKKFSQKFLKELTKNWMETSNNSKEKLHRNPKEILKIFGPSWKYVHG